VDGPVRDRAKLPRITLEHHELGVFSVCFVLIRHESFVLCTPVAEAESGIGAKATSQIRIIVDSAMVFFFTERL
jgi:hypothetical protein